MCIVSFHPPKFLDPFFAGGWLVVERVHEIVIAGQRGHPPVTVLLARRPVDGRLLPPPTGDLEDLIASSVRSWHTNDDPLLTETERERKSCFCMCACACVCVVVGGYWPTCLCLCLMLRLYPVCVLMRCDSE